MQQEKKQLEILIMHYFREFYNEFPKGVVVPTESPDFTVKMKNHRILGIELTRLNPGNAVVLSGIQKETVQFREQFIVFSKELFEQKSSLKLFVKFLFSEKQPLLPEQKLIAAVQVANRIKDAVQGKNPNSFFRILLDKSQLPSGLKEVLIVRHPKLETSIWERSNNLGISNDVVDDIHFAIHKKDEKLRLYQKQRLNYYWLLITTDKLRGAKSFNLPDKIMNHKFHSHFQHVFLFDLMKSDIYELI